MPAGDTPFSGVFGLTRMLAYFLAKRPELAHWLDISTEEGVLKANAWLFVHGLVEHRLLYRITPELRRHLMAPAPFLPQTAGHSPISWILFFLWMCVVDLQERFDLRDETGQTAFLRWFSEGGAAEYGLEMFLPDGHEGFAPERSMSEANDASGKTREPRPFGVNLVGYARGELGIGEDLRMAVAACEAAKIPYSLVNLDPGSSASQGDRSLEAQLAAAQGGGFAPFFCNVFCLTGFETARAYLEIGPKLFSGRYNIGWWPWELPVWPRDWAPALELVDEIWAATRFTHVMYQNALMSTHGESQVRPVIHMPLAVSVSRLQAVTRAELGLQENAFLFLYIFDFNSYLARKNPFAAIDAFQKAFPSDPEVGLVLKTMNSQARNPAWRKFRAACAQDARITLIDRTLTRGQVLGLVDCCDAYLSLHRAEGFGRTLAEAMLLGKPVVATDFSGNRDFLDTEHGFPVRWRRRAVRVGEYPFVTKADGAWWAEPDLGDAAHQMREARDRAGKANTNLVAAAQAMFSPARAGARMHDRLREIFRKP
jgi:glycosyltransferase involved in cell wall biosynthesis